MRDYNISDSTINGQIIGDVKGNAIDNSDRSVNYNINNYELRWNLKDRYNPENPIEYEYSAYCVGRYGKKIFDNYISITCVNLHSNNLFMHDHIHIKLPVDWYEDSIFDNNVMKFKGIVEPYTRSNNTIDYTINVSKVISITNRIHGIHNNSLRLTPLKFTDHFLESAKYTIENELSKDIIVEFVIRLLTILDTSICSQDDVIYLGFVSNIILSYYFMNTNLNDLCQQKYLLREFNKEILLDIGKIVSTVMISINEDKNSIYLWRHLFILVSKICNVLQGISKDTSKRNKRNKDEFEDVFNALKLFGNKINSKNTKKMFNKLKMRHVDFGYKYPEDKEKFENLLWDNLCKMFYYQGYLKSN